MNLIIRLKQLDISLVERSNQSLNNFTKALVHDFAISFNFIFMNAVEFKTVIYLFLEIFVNLKWYSAPAFNEITLILFKFFALFESTGCCPRLDLDLCRIAIFILSIKIIVFIQEFKEFMVWLLHVHIYFTLLDLLSVRWKYWNLTLLSVKQHLKFYSVFISVYLMKIISRN